tara:strand:- start:814 stop:1584 length:771 start_codon:yes stop_codon:yes gene_type:complete
MKKLLLLLLFLPVIGLAQYLNLTSTWHESGSSWTGSGSYSWEHEISINNQVLIAPYTYYELSIQGSWTNTSIDPAIPPTNGPINSIAYLREDNGKWYTYQNGNDVLLYDFINISSGTDVSSFWGYINTPSPSPPPNFTTYNLINFGGSQRKVWDLDNTYVKVIEGIGASSGLFGFYAMPIEAGMGIYCFTQDTNYYPSSISCQDTSNTVSLVTLIENNKKLVKKIDILGRETEEKRNIPLFYIYNDGTVEKKMIIE